MPLQNERMPLESTIAAVYQNIKTSSQTQKVLISLNLIHMSVIILISNEKITGINVGEYSRLDNLEMIIKYILVLAFFQGIVFEKTCHGQFHWAKSGNDDTKDAVRALLQDLYGSKLQAQVIFQGRT